MLSNFEGSHGKSLKWNFWKTFTSNLGQFEKSISQPNNIQKRRTSEYAFQGELREKSEQRKCDIVRKRLRYRLLKAKSLYQHQILVNHEVLLFDNLKTAPSSNGVGAEDTTKLKRLKCNPDYLIQPVR